MGQDCLKADAIKRLRQEESCKVSSDLEVELELLRTTLETKGAELHDIIKGETQRKEAELQVRETYTCLFLSSVYFFCYIILYIDHRCQTLVCIAVKM